MSRRHKRQEAPMSFFSFQDVISCITGLMILVTLMLALELVNRTEGGQDAKQAPRPDEPDPDALRAKVVELRKQRDELERLRQARKIELDALEGRTRITPQQLKELANQVIALEGRIKDVTLEVQRKKDRPKEPEDTGFEGLPGVSPSGKTAIFVECAKDAITAGKLASGATTERPQRFTGANCLRSFINWAKGRDKAKEYFALLVRPEGAEYFSPILNELDSSGFDLGWGVCLPELKPFGEGESTRGQP